MTLMVNIGTIRNSHTPISIVNTCITAIITIIIITIVMVTIVTCMVTFTAMHAVSVTCMYGIDG